MFKRLDTKKKREARLYNTLRATRFQSFITAVLVYVIPTVFITVESFFMQQETVAVENIPFNLWTLFVEELKHPIRTFTRIKTSEELFPITAIIVGLLLTLLLLRFRFYWRRFRTHKVEDASDYGAYDTAKWATGKEVLAKNDFTSDINDSAEFGALIGKTMDTKEYIIRKCTSRLNAHTLGVAGSGKGKTTGYILNQVILNKTRSIVSSDGKGEIYKLTSKQKQAEGFKVLYMDFVKFLGDRWNCLADLSFDDIDNFSTNLVQSADDDSNNVWGANAINLISACIAYVFEVEKKTNQNMTTVRQLINLGEAPIKELFSELPDDSIAKDYFSDIQGATDKVWTGIETTAKSATRFWKQKRIQRFTECSDFSFTDLGKEKIAMYIRIHPTDKTYEVLQNTFFKQLFNKLIEEGDGRYPVEIDFQLDEFTNIGKIPNMQQIVSFVRALGLNLSMFIQDISQLYSVYGEHDAKSIISNCDNFVFLGTNESSATAPFIEKKLGETTKILRDNGGKAKDTEHTEDSLNYKYFKRSLMSVSEIQKMPDSQGIYFHAGGDPLLFSKVFSYQLFPNLEEVALGWHIDFDKREQKPREQSKISQLLSEGFSEVEEFEEDNELTDSFTGEFETENDGNELPY